MTITLSEIDQVRYQRDTARAENMRLRQENERLRELLKAAKKPIRAEYLLRTTGSEMDTKGD
jgi:regulator of replication initiation timing